VPRFLFAILLVAGAHTAPAQATNGVLEGRRNDLAVFRREFFMLDSSYAPAQRAEAERRLTALESRLGTATAVEFELELARIVALADNGHTNSPASLRSRRYSRIPIRLAPFGDQFHVLRAETAHADLLGARLLAIDGKTLRELRATGHTLWGGTPAWRDRSLPFLLESPEQMHTLGLTRTAASAIYRFELRTGQVVDRRIDASPPDAQREMWNAARWYSPLPLDSDSGKWRHVADPARAPWAFQDIQRVFRTRVDSGLNAVVIQMRVNHNGAGQNIAEFMNMATEEVRRVKPRHVILDIRTNGGGDLNNTRDFVKQLPTLVPGRVFVLTSPWTFSAAISTVGYLKQAGGNKVTIVGEMVGDRLEFWAEGRLARLPFTGAAMSYSTQRHDYKTGCTPYTDCHGSVVRHPIAVPSLAPDIDAPLTIEAFIAGRDPGMEAVAVAIRK
jgi:hypothetical protein